MNAINPGDIYTHVANMVDKRVREEASDPTKKYFELAKKL